MRLIDADALIQKRNHAKNYMYDCGYVGLAIYNEPNHYYSCGERKEN